MPTLRDNLTILVRATALPDIESGRGHGQYSFASGGKALADSHRIELRGSGSFKVKEYDGYHGRNLKAGEKIEVGPKQLPVFRLGKGLRERVMPQQFYPL